MHILRDGRFLATFTGTRALGPATDCSTSSKDRAEQRGELPKSTETPCRLLKFTFTCRSHRLYSSAVDAIGGARTDGACALCVPPEHELIHKLERDLVRHVLRHLRKTGSGSVGRCVATGVGQKTTAGWTVAAVRHVWPYPACSLWGIAGTAGTPVDSRLRIQWTPVRGESRCGWRTGNESGITFTCAAGEANEQRKRQGQAGGKSRW